MPGGYAERSAFRSEPVSYTHLVPTIASFYQQWSSVLGEPNLTKKMVLDEAKRLTTKLIAQGGEDFSSPP